MPFNETPVWLALRARRRRLRCRPHGLSLSRFELHQVRDRLFAHHLWRLFLNGSDPHQRLGFLQLDVFGKKNENTAVTVEVAGKIAAHFPADLKMLLLQSNGSYHRGAPIVARRSATTRISWCPRQCPTNVLPDPSTRPATVPQWLGTLNHGRRT